MSIIFVCFLEEASLGLLDSFQKIPKLLHEKKISPGRYDGILENIYFFQHKPFVNLRDLLNLLREKIFFKGKYIRKTYVSFPHTYIFFSSLKKQITIILTQIGSRIT